MTLYIVLLLFVFTSVIKRDVLSRNFLNIHYNLGKEENNG